LCFALLTSFCAAQNNLPFYKGGIHSEVVYPFFYSPLKSKKYVGKE
jgi:hypothetical protein